MIVMGQQLLDALIVKFNKAMYVIPMEKVHYRLWVPLRNVKDVAMEFSHGTNNAIQDLHFPISMTSATICVKLSITSLVFLILISE